VKKLNTENEETDVESEKKQDPKLKKNQKAETLTGTKKSARNFSKKPIVNN